MEALKESYQVFQAYKRKTNNKTSLILQKQQKFFINLMFSLFF